MTTVTNRLRGGLYLSALIAALAGCASPTPAGTGVGQLPTTPSTGQPVTTTEPPPSPPGGHQTASGTRCASAILHLEIGAGDNSAGHIGLVVIFTNTSSRTCTMYGYPGVSFLTSGGAQINEPAKRSSAQGGPTLVPVLPGGRAHADLLLVNVANYAGNPNCQPTVSARIRVYPPDESAALFANTAQQLCEVKGTGVPVIYPVKLGASDS